MFVRSAIPDALRVVLLAAFLLPAGAYSQDGSGEPESKLQIDAGAGRYDAATGRMTLTRVRISEAGYEIVADQADSDSFDLNDATWNFLGNVHFRALTASLTCDSAELRFEDDRLKSASIRGAPVRMRNEGDVVIEGNAATVEYDAESQLVRFMGGAVLETRASRVSGQSITYDLRNETVTVNPPEGEPVMFTFDFFTSQQDEEP
ncbi:MAG: hypothetical protein OXJ63_09825 [Gammaproteobacteria bacterium]|nr:hypothetical protein [Gammaproteobacteria bacterium]MDE0455591.1 hypothetical protein [Gammaproteobacteria bacterium]